MKIVCGALIVSMCALLIACDDPEEFPAKALGPFDKIQSNGGVTFNLVTGPDNRVISTSINESSYSVSGGQLNINASGGSMTIAVRSLSLLWCNACHVKSSELTADTLNMWIHGGRADLHNLTILRYLGLSANNTGTYEFSGTAAFFNAHNVNNADIEAFNLVTDSTYLDCWAGLARTEVHATKVLNVFIHGAGSVYYTGNPPVVRFTSYGLGKLIPK